MHRISKRIGELNMSKGAEWNRMLARKKILMETMTKEEMAQEIAFIQILKELDKEQKALDKW
tara:strand:+ start:213 stop:398 length:186 start_codon:yes stop_codon:yes gene_type:complete